MRTSFDAVSQVLKKHEKTFFDVVNAKLNLLKLKRKKVLTENLTTRIESASNEDAKEILFDHLSCNADMAALREYCEMIIVAEAFPKMQKLGEEMLSELPPEGLLQCCVVCSPRSPPPMFDPTPFLKHLWAGSRGGSLAC